MEIYNLKGGPIFGGLTKKPEISNLRGTAFGCRPYYPKIYLDLDPIIRGRVNISYLIIRIRIQYRICD
jgi:hypothetical protein